MGRPVTSPDEDRDMVERRRGSAELEHAEVPACHECLVAPPVSWVSSWIATSTKNSSPSPMRIGT